MRWWYLICSHKGEIITKHLIMYKVIFLFCCLSFIACSNNESSTPAENKGDTANTTSNALPHVTNLQPESELEVLASCVDNAKAQLGEQKAFALCKCVLGQVQQKYPGADSTAIVAHLSDTAQVAQMAKQCQE
jgi:hypothetical protein